MSRAMKDSGIPWIGEIPSHWVVSRVKNCFIRKNEKAHQENPVILSLARSGVRVRDISTNEGQMAESYYDYNPVEENDLLINPMDLYSGANCSISRVKGVISPAYVNLRFTNGAVPRFYDYYFKTQYWAMALFAHGRGISFDNRWTLGVDTLFNYFIPVPSHNEQQSIADFLDKKCGEIDEMVSLQEKIVEELKAYKQSVITETVCKGLNPDVPKKDSGIEWIGEVPLSTVIIRLKFISDISRGLFNHRPRDDERYYNGGFPFIQTGDVARSGKYITTYSQTLSQLGTTVSKLFPKGTMTMTIAANVGDVAILDFDAYFPDSVLGIVPNNNVQKDYLYYVIVASKAALINAATANTQLNLNVQSVGSIFIPLSPIKEQQAIADYLDTKCAEIDALISLKQSKIDALKEYKKSIIYEYITGKKAIIA